MCTLPLVNYHFRLDFGPLGLVPIKFLTAGVDPA